MFITIYDTLFILTMNPSESSNKNNNDDIAESSAGTCTGIITLAPATAAATTATTDKNDDERIAIQIFVMEQLIESYGYKYDIAVEAFDIVYENNSIVNSASDKNKDYIKILEQCCSYILDNQLDTDHGGPIIPITNCPHILSAQPFITNNNIQNETTILNYYYPTPAMCTHIMTNDKEEKDNNITKGKSIRPTFDDNDEDKNTNNNKNSTIYCSSTVENWVCYTCGTVRCSRYVNGHTLNHWQYYSTRSNNNTTKNTTNTDNDNDDHSIVISLTDLSVWCHDCSSYITNSTKLDPIITQLQQMKFGTDTESSETEST